MPDIAPDAPPGSISYSSSGVELVGVWTQATLTFPDAKDAQGNVATAVVPVLAVREKKVHSGAVNSSSHQPSLNPKIYMLGIGTGRGKVARQDKNPWVNLNEMKAGTMRRGYTITPEGITLGLRREGVGDGYMFEKLKEHTGEVADAKAVQGGVRDWDGSRGWVEVGGRRCQESSMLLDTGLTNMMIQAPEPEGDGPLADGTDVTVRLLSGRLSYSFQVGDRTNLATPSKVSWVRYSMPLVNTGLRTLALYDYLYDADAGYFGPRPRKK